MSVTIDEVRYIARLARLRFTEEEEGLMAEQMSKILDYMDQLNELDTEGVPPMSHVLDLTNVFREDVATRRISREEALRNAPDADEAYFRAPKVIEG
jgi:aspartyl-tRNA(Asn)/glutamyl-tRNA(Gln) amidotransferase subunit C